MSREPIGFMVLDYGTVVAQGAPGQVMKSAEVRAVYVGEAVEE